MKLPLILASESPARLQLLRQIHIIPDLIIPANIDERELKNEQPRELAKRLAYQKAITVADNYKQAVVIGSDTVPVVGTRIMRKATNSLEVKESLIMLSQRRHRIYTGVCVIKKDNNGVKVSQKVVKSILKFKKLSPAEIDFYCLLGEGIGKAGGYTVSGYAESFVSFISGSFSNIIGLPLFETMNMLNSAGIKPYYNHSL